MTIIKSIRLKYLPADQTDGSAEAQPCIITPTGRKPMRLVPIAPLIKGQCTGCIGNYNDHPSAADTMLDVVCDSLPVCDKAIYVRASPNNKLRHVAWLLEQND